MLKYTIQEQVYVKDFIEVFFYESKSIGSNI